VSIKILDIKKYLLKYEYACGHFSMYFIDDHPDFSHWEAGIGGIPGQMWSKP
jgi:hypothetical protein